MAKRIDNRTVADAARDLATPLCRQEGIEVIHAEYAREPGGRVLRLYLDKPGGVTLDDCARVSRQVGDLLDARMPIDESYRLEVSSPGPNRPLGRAEDFGRHIGRRARLWPEEPIDGKKRLTGTIVAVDGGTVELDTDQGTVRVEVTALRKAHLIEDNGER